MKKDERDIIRDELRRRGLTQRDLADALGVHWASIGRLLRKERALKADERDKIFQFLGLCTDKTRPRLRSIPVIGAVSAGDWREAVRDPVGEMLVEGGGPHAFGLRVAGDSMDLIIPDGGLIAVDPDDRLLLPGRIYVVQREGGDATVKRYEAAPARLVPLSTNPDHRPIILGSEPVTVIGRVFYVTGRC